VSTPRTPSSKCSKSLAQDCSDEFGEKHASVLGFDRRRFGRSRIAELAAALTVALVNVHRHRQRRTTTPRLTIRLQLREVPSSPAVRAIVEAVGALPARVPRPQRRPSRPDQHRERP
jgi:hypothetical protein